MEATSLTKGGVLYITKYFIKLRVIWNELEIFQTNLVCTCQTRCSCFFHFESMSTKPCHLWAG